MQEARGRAKGLSPRGIPLLPDRGIVALFGGLCEHITSADHVAVERDLADAAAAAKLHPGYALLLEYGEADFRHSTPLLLAARLGAGAGGTPIDDEAAQAGASIVRSLLQAAGHGWQQLHGQPPDAATAQSQMALVANDLLRSPVTEALAVGARRSVKLLLEAAEPGVATYQVRMSTQVFCRVCRHKTDNDVLQQRTGVCAQPHFIHIELQQIGM